MRQLFGAVITALLLCCASISHAQTDKTKTTDNEIDVWGTEFKAKFSIRVEARPIFPLPRPVFNTLSGFPESVRTIPGHPDDPWAKTLFKIPDASYEYIDPKYITGFGAVNVTFFNLASVNVGIVNFGTQYSGPHLTEPHPYEIGIPEVNQYNRFERGYGRALVYYNLKSRITQQTSLAPEIELHLPKWFSVLAGRTQYNFGYDVVRGYDRYDSQDDTIDTQKVADIKVKVNYYGLRMEIMKNEFAHISLLVIYVPTPKIQTTYGQGMEGVHINSTLPSRKMLITGAIRMRLIPFPF